MYFILQQFSLAKLVVRLEWIHPGLFVHIVCGQYFLSMLLFLLQVKFEDVQCMYPGLYKAQVTVGDQTFGPKKSSTKKMARKFVAIVALKALMNWEPAEGMLFSLMLQPMDLLLLFSPFFTLRTLC